METNARGSDEPLTGSGGHSTPNPELDSESSDFPSLCELASDISVDCNLLPLPFPDRPVRSCSASSRIRRRFALRLQVWRVAASLVKLINDMDSGKVTNSEKDRRMTFRKSGTRVTVSEDAVNLALSRILSSASHFVKARRGLGLTGVHGARDRATCELLKCAADECGYMLKN